MVVVVCDVLEGRREGCRSVLPGGGVGVVVVFSREAVGVGFFSDGPSGGAPPPLPPSTASWRRRGGETRGAPSPPLPALAKMKEEVGTVGEAEEGGKRRYSRA